VALIGGKYVAGPQRGSNAGGRPWPRWWARRCFSPLLSSLNRCPRSSGSASAIYPTLRHPVGSTKILEETEAVLFRSQLVLGNLNGSGPQRPASPSRAGRPEPQRHPPELKPSATGHDTSASRARSDHPKAAGRAGCKLFLPLLMDSQPQLIGVASAQPAISWPRLSSSGPLPAS